MHSSTFEYLKPTDGQIAQMGVLRIATAQYASILIAYLPEGPDKTYILRKLREVAMWANVAITRHTDGSPRSVEGGSGGLKEDNGGVFHGLARNSLDQPQSYPEKGSKGPGPEMAGPGKPHPHD
jgi:hypothetical protein